MSALRPEENAPTRVAEAILLVVALALGMGGMWMVGYSIQDGLPEGFWTYSIVLAALAFTAHIVLRLRAPYADQVILPAVILLNSVSMAMILRQDLDPAGIDGANASRHLMWTALGIIVACVALFAIKDHRSLRRLTYTAMIVGIVLVILPLVPGLGREINGAQIWIFIGPFSAQPAEFAKIAFAVFFAGYLVANRDTLALAGKKFLGLQLPRLRDLGPILIVWAVSLAVLVGEKDLGTSLLFFGLFVGMLYLATDRVGWIVIGLTMFAGGAVLAWSIFSHVQLRVNIWLDALNPDLMNGPSYQLVQGLFAMSYGGMFGAGWGEGYPEYIPFAFSDFIYASLGEELGLTGLLAILLIYLVIVQRGLRHAIGVRDGFGKLLAGGLAFVMALQLFVVVGGITRVIPLTGLTLPFMAQGGSSLLANWIVIALMLRISDAARRPSALPTRGALADPVPAAANGDAIAVGGAGPVQAETEAGAGRGATPDDATQIVRGVDR
ncbi:FtsW/RodA/SpoVE family cell cycle protein [Promicromonospora iranensis]|uniref:Cell division protein FtsW (Lipid II flippase) n=1 Tax=Promicromonospora iranensis TaxID=1105144 RepID=A0ABU2CPK1_9MICO|nr:FtsW/RodA/SpoVE family cell cycle protein [Promicromonospora iranensis]MDR7383279.1 cell division protein FtsW (lipid II flippase) [Promicromonospora iranensis]